MPHPQLSYKLRSWLLFYARVERESRAFYSIAESPLSTSNLPRPIQYKDYLVKRTHDLTPGAECSDSLRPTCDRCGERLEEGEELV
jgi:hypothetical protein